MAIPEFPPGYRPPLHIDAAQAKRMYRLSLLDRMDEILPVVRRVFDLDAQQWPDHKLRGPTIEKIDTALSLGLTSFTDIIAFMVLLRTVSPRFYEFPKVKQFLARKDLPLNGRVERMLLELHPGTWDVVARRT